MGNLETAIEEIAKQSLGREDWDVPLDYFSWGRDKRHMVDDTESLPSKPTQLMKKLLNPRIVIGKMRSLIGKGRYSDSLSATMLRFKSDYAAFDETYQLMSDDYSRNLFAELIFIKLVSEKRMRLSSFTQEFIDSYEVASDQILKSQETLQVYTWILRKITLTDPPVSFFTVPNLLNLHLTGKLYRYENGKTIIGVSKGDVVIDAGVGWGDTTIYFAAIADGSAGGHIYAFDILEEGLNALAEQIKVNPDITNITPTLRGLSNKDGDQVNISAPSPGAKITNEKTERTIDTITIDSFVDQKNLDKVDMIKMDIEGAEVPALIGATHTIKKHKPKLAISAYHKWDDLLEIPKLIHSMRDDYDFYLDCTTGFGGEAVLFCE